MCVNNLKLPVIVQLRTSVSGVTIGVVCGFKPPHPKILKALQNCTKLNLIVKTVKNC